MAVKVVNGDLFTTKAKYICHQVNCKGRMGSGVARQVRAKYPEVYSAYMYACQEQPVILGQSQFVPCDDGKMVVNMFTQNSYGYDGKQYTNYAAFQKCLRAIKEAVPPAETIAMPYKIGCGLGGGDWGTVLRLIKEELGATHMVELWRLLEWRCIFFTVTGIVRLTRATKSWARTMKPIKLLLI